MNRLTGLLAAIDAANAADPHGQELFYGRRMSEMLQMFAPSVDDCLKIAVRGQHIERWLLPRHQYPEGRTGYLRWRIEQKNRHAHRLAELMQNHNYTRTEIDRVGALVRKERFKTDADAQCLEDIACLVFLKYYAADFIAKHEPDKVTDIIRKTWAKMSEKGHAAAQQLDLSAALSAAIGRALS